MPQFRAFCLLALLLAGQVSRAQDLQSGDPEVVSLLEAEYTSLDDFCDRLTRLEKLLAGRGDPRAIFAAMYRVLTEKAIRSMEEGFFDDPEWTQRFVVSFGNLYRVAFLEHETGHADRIPGAWRIAFDAVDDDRITVFQHAILGIHAHINHDLAFALAEVTPPGERARRFHDYTLTNRFLIGSVDDVEAILASAFDSELGALDDDLGGLDEALLRRLLSRWRNNAWRLSALFDGSRSPLQEEFYAALLDRLTARRARYLLGSAGQ